LEGAGKIRKRPAFGFWFSGNGPGYGRVIDRGALLIFLDLQPQ
jgi:hypothetical protein